MTGILDGMTDNCHGQSVIGLPNEEVPQGALLDGPNASDSVPERSTPASEETGPGGPDGRANDPTSRDKKRSGSPPNSSASLASDVNKKFRNV